MGTKDRKAAARLARVVKVCVIVVASGMGMLVSTNPS